ncbi:MAG: DUF1552 domain-containing protein [Solirubrobacterales bacterium]|nr:DUF1552 domain-containing protein [Solirubrobacterales bacterium]
MRLARAGYRLQRRMFLQALALGLSLPLAAKIARIATAAAPVAPKRFFLMYMPHGIPPEHYNPQIGSGGPTDFALDQTNVSILGPLQPYKSYVNVYSGFQYVGPAATHAGIVNCLSGITAVDPTTPRTTVEQVIAKGLGVKPLILGACSHLPYGLDNNGMLFWDGTPIDPQKNPAKVADTLFGTGAAPAPTVNADAQLRSDLLALTASEIQGLQSELTGLTREQNKLAQHLSAIQSLQSSSSMGAAPVSCTGKPPLPTVDMVRAASAGQVVDPSGANDYFYQEKNFPLLFQAQLELVAQAIICNAAQVIALMPMYATCDFDFTFAGAPGSHHNGLSHTSPQAVPTAQWNSPVSVANYNPMTRSQFAKAQLWFCQQLVTKVVSVLATTDDPAAPGTKVLDNTLIYWMSEIGDGQNHTRTSEIESPQVPTYLPLVTIGKCAGAFKSGQVVQFPMGTTDPMAAAMINRPATDLYLSLAKAMGVPNATFPNTTGPVTEVLA